MNSSKQVKPKTWKAYYLTEMNELLQSAGISVTLILSFVPASIRLWNK